MSILIKGMEMPKSGCVITIYKIDGNFYASKNGTELCPLVEIPPHGRLIDADVLFRTMEKTPWYNNADRDNIAEELVLNAPSIIEAAGERQHDISV